MACLIVGDNWEAVTADATTSSTTSRYFINVCNDVVVDNLTRSCPKGAAICRVSKSDSCCSAVVAGLFACNSRVAIPMTCDLQSVSLTVAVARLWPGCLPVIVELPSL